MNNTYQSSFFSETETSFVDRNKESNTTSKKVTNRETEYQNSCLSTKMFPVMNDLREIRGETFEIKSSNYVDTSNTSSFYQIKNHNTEDVNEASCVNLNEENISPVDISKTKLTQVSCPLPTSSGYYEKRSRWGGYSETGFNTKKNKNMCNNVSPESTPKKIPLDETPMESQWKASPLNPVIENSPLPKEKSRWDVTPTDNPSILATPIMGLTPMIGMTPIKPLEIENQTLSTQTDIPITPDQFHNMKIEKELWEKNRPLTYDELDVLIPKDGYKIISPPSNYEPTRTPIRKPILTAPAESIPQMYQIPKDMNSHNLYNSLPEGLPEIKQEDHQFFAQLTHDVDENELTIEQVKERRILKLLLKIKNGSAQQRKTALKHITEKAREIGSQALFDQILPILMSPTTEDQERHLMVKVIDRILHRLQDLVRPYVHKILIVVMPMLIDEDYYARVEGREIVTNLAKAAGQATMISALRPDIDNTDEYVRNTAARAIAVICCAFGIQTMIPFFKAVTKSKKSWQARHTGIKIVQQLAILIGCSILPHLNHLVEVVKDGLEDDHQKVRTITALAISALAEAATPYGIESFDTVLRPLWEGIRKHRGKVLASFLKAIGFIVPLMDITAQNYYTKEVMVILLREFQTHDEEMKKIVLKVVKQCVATEGVEPRYVQTEIIEEFFKHFWQRKSALDKRNYKQVVETTVSLAEKVGGHVIIEQIKDDLKDESEPYRRMVMETIDKIISSLGMADIKPRLEEELVDGALFLYQEQLNEDNGWIILNGFTCLINGLKHRVIPYLPQICGSIKWRMNNKNPKSRQQGADLIARIAHVIYCCGEKQLLQHLGQILFEYLGEGYPEVLGSILGAFKSLVNILGMQEMNPPIKDLLPRLTPILKNRHETVQENCIDLVGRIADRGSDLLPNREWMRICFDMLELLKAPKKSIRRATVNTFGYIAKAIGPNDVIDTLLNNLKVQERQNRVCTTVAIAIVAETCFPFTILPALMNEYKVPEINVQNGILKSLSFMFEYIGEMGKDYVYSVVPILEDALIDRDLVHRQTAAFTIQHLSLGVVGLSCEDALTHLLNYVWPNIFEESTHIIQATIGAIGGMRLALGSCTVLLYILQGLYHPAKKVRQIYWRLYNDLYLGSQDALVAFFPPFDDEPTNRYRRHEIELLI
jgi:splicing factor 3B subunit 1